MEKEKAKTIEANADNEVLQTKVIADGTVTGIDEQLTEIKESYKDLFAKDTLPEPILFFYKNY